MNLKSGLMQIVVIGALVVIAGNVVAFAVPFEHTTTFWVSYIFMWIVFIVAIAANWYVVASSRSATSSLYRVSISSVSIAYLIISVACSVGFIALRAPVWMVLAVQVVLLVICLISLVGGATGARLVENDEAVTREQTFYITTLRSQVEALKASLPDGDAQESLSRLLDDLRYSDPVSSPAVMTLENDLADHMTKLYTAVQIGNSMQVSMICGQMQAILAQRNALCRSSK